VALGPEELAKLVECPPDLQGKTWLQIVHVFGYEDTMAWLHHKGEMDRSIHFKRRDPELAARNHENLSLLVSRMGIAINEATGMGGETSPSNVP
jgi:hypothetical protein